MKNVNYCITWSLKTKVRQQNCLGTGPEVQTWSQEALFAMSIFHFYSTTNLQYMYITEYLQETKVA